MSREKYWVGQKVRSGFPMPSYGPTQYNMYFPIYLPSLPRSGSFLCREKLLKKESQPSKADF